MIVRLRLVELSAACMRQNEEGTKEGFASLV